MTFDLTVVAPIVAFVLSIIALGTQIKTILSSGEKALDRRLAKAESTLITHDRRVQSIENDLKHLPDRDSTHRLEIAMAEINGKLNVMNERLKPIEAIGERIQDTLLEGARK